MEEVIAKEEKIFLALSVIFVALLVISNLVASKIIMIGGLVGPAAVGIYALTYAISDSLTELWGEKRVKYVIKLGFIASVLVALMVELAINLPPAPFWEGQAQFEAVLGSSFRVVIASIVAYLVSQYHDVWAFNFWKRLTKGKHLWLRNNLSTIISQLIDTVIFITLAFYGTGVPVVELIVGQYIFKLIIAIGDTPLVYLLVNWIKKELSDKGDLSKLDIKQLVVED